MFGLEIRPPRQSKTITIKSVLTFGFLSESVFMNKSGKIYAYGAIRKGHNIKLFNLLNIENMTAKTNHKKSQE